MLQSKDTTLSRCVKEVADELDIHSDIVWKVYNHYLGYIHKLMTADTLRNYNIEKRRELAKNIVIPGLGRLLNKYGKTYRTKGVVETKKVNYDTDESEDEDSTYEAED